MPDRRLTDEQAEALRGQLLAYLCRNWQRLDAEAHADVAQDAILALLAKHASGVPPDSDEGYVIACAKNAANRKLNGADAVRRSTFDPLHPVFAGLPDAEPPPDEQVESADDARRIRLLIDSLSDEREKAIFKLRLDEKLDPSEIRDRLDLTFNRYRKLAKRAGRSLAYAMEDWRSGTWSERQRSLFCACLMGVASPRQRERARDLLEDPHCRALFAELRRVGERAAVLMPLPAATHGEARRSLLEQASYGAQKVWVNAQSLIPGRDATQALGNPAVASARPGAALAAATVCLGLVGTGGYCAVEGVSGLGPVLPDNGGQEVKNESAKQAEPEAPPAADSPVVTAVPDPPREPKPPAPSRQPAASPAPTPPAGQQLGLDPDRPPSSPTVRPSPSTSGGPRPTATGGGDIVLP